MVNTKNIGGKKVLKFGANFGSSSLPRLVDRVAYQVRLKMSDKGGIEAIFYFKSSSSDLASKEPSIEIVAVPLNIDAEALFVRAGVLRMQVNRTHVNDNDLDAVEFGPCTGYVTVYPGYVSKQMEPPKVNVKTYWIDWCSLYRDSDNYYFSCRYTMSDLGDNDDYFWGRFG